MHSYLPHLLEVDLEMHSAVEEVNMELHCVVGVNLIEVIFHFINEISEILRIDPKRFISRAELHDDASKNLEHDDGGALLRHGRSRNLKQWR
jgi:hypothetical protein